MRLIPLICTMLFLSSCMAVAGVASRPQVQVAQQPTQDDEAAKREAQRVLEFEKAERERAEQDRLESEKQASDKDSKGDQAPEEPMQHGFLYIETSLGKIEIALESEAAPKTVANIQRYVDDGFYDGTVFHRVIADFMIQGGGFAADPVSKRFIEKKTYAPIKNEGDNGFRNVRGSVAMARTSKPDSATSQFYINIIDNPHLDAKDGNPGYCVFGQVVRGMDVVDKIAAVQTTRGNWPVTPIIIKSVHMPKGPVQVPTEDSGGPQRPAPVMEEKPAEKPAERTEKTAEPETATVNYFAEVTSFAKGSPSVINVNAGSDAGIQKGDQLLVKQGGKTICTASVTRVAKTKAIAEITNDDWQDGVQVDIKIGDEVDLK